MTKKYEAYLIAGRLKDVIAAVTVMAADEEATRKIGGWVDHLSKVEAGAARGAEVARWTRVFEDHPEFFLVYTLSGEASPKAALRLRYANKTIDRVTKQEPADIKALTPDERYNLISLPLSEGLVNVLVTTAINMHSATIARNADARYWIPLAAAILSLFGALVGSLVAPLVTKSDKPAPPPQIQLVMPSTAAGSPARK